MASALKQVAPMAPPDPITGSSTMAKAGKLNALPKQAKSRFPKPTLRKTGFQRKSI